MKIICLKKYLKEAVVLCEKIINKNLSLPILNNILISGEGRILKLTSTNLEIGLNIEIPAKIEKEGKITVPAHIINNFLSSFSIDGNISLQSQNNNLLILTSNTSSLIKSQPYDDFPILPEIKEKKEIEILIDDFILGLKSVYYSSSFLNIKPEISSVYVILEKNTPLTFVATDSFRLAEKKFNYHFKENIKILIPLKSVIEILRIFEGKKGKIKLIADKNQIFLGMDNIKFISRLTDGIFPDYEQIIPKKFTTDVIVDKKLFIDSLRMANIFSGKFNGVNIIIDLKNKFITINTSNQETGEHTSNITAKITGEKLNITFNYKYVFDCLQYIPSSNIILRFSGEGKPMVITGVDDNSFQYLVMPMDL